MSDANIEVRVFPRSARKRVTVDENGLVRLYINAPPVEGKANAECIALLAKRLDIPKSSIEIFRGERGRNKVIRLKGLSEEQVLSMLRGGDD